MTVNSFFMRNILIGRIMKKPYYLSQIIGYIIFRCNGKEDLEVNSHNLPYKYWLEDKL